MILHLVNERRTVAPEFAAPGDVIVLIENGVYSQFKDIACDVYAIGADCDARGVTPHGNTKKISYEEFVDLCTRLDKVVSW